MNNSNEGNTMSQERTLSAKQEKMEKICRDLVEMEATVKDPKASEYIRYAVSKLMCTLDDLES